MFVDLNAGVGESFRAGTLRHGEALFAFLSSANVACGVHAGDAVAIPERACLRDGRPVVRSVPGANIHGPYEAARRAGLLVKEGRVDVLGGGFFEFEVDTLCIRDHNPNAAEIAHAVRAALEAEGVESRAVGVPVPHQFPPEVPT